MPRGPCLLAGLIVGLVTSASGCRLMPVATRPFDTGEILNAAGIAPTSTLDQSAPTSSDPTPYGTVRPAPLPRLPDAPSASAVTVAPPQTASTSDRTPMLDAAAIRLQAIQIASTNGQHLVDVTRHTDPAIDARINESAADIEHAMKSPTEQIQAAEPEPPQLAEPPGNDQPKPDGDIGVIRASAEVEAETVTDDNQDAAGPAPSLIKPGELRFEIPPLTLTDSSPATDPAPNSIIAHDLAVVELRLCSKVLGYGRYEPLADSRVRPGQAVTIYCELEGLHSEPAGDSFRSRLETRIELVRDDASQPDWSESIGPGEDLCRRPRRDVFVNYRVTIPEKLTPGEYSLRLVQHDLLNNQVATRAMPISIAK